MAKEIEGKPEVVETKSKQTSSVSLDELQAIVNAAVTAALQQTANQGEQIASALLKAREPYVDPKQKANEESMRRSMHASDESQRRALAQDQLLCTHRKGSNALSSFPAENNYAFIKHVLDTGEIIGICTNCTKVISSVNDGRDGRPNEINFFQLPSTNGTSQAGRRFFDDPLKAQRARHGFNQKEIFVDEQSGELVER